MADDRDISELWEAMTKLREGQTDNSLALARIEEQGRGNRELLTERCEARRKTMDEIRNRQDQQESRIGELERKERFAQGKAAGVAAVLALIAAFLAKLWR